MKESWCRGTWCSTNPQTTSCQKRRRSIHGTWLGSRSSATAGTCCWSVRSAIRRPRVQWRSSDRGKPPRSSFAITRSSTKAWSRPGRCGSGTRSRARSERTRATTGTAISTTGRTPPSPYAAPSATGGQLGLQGYDRRAQPHEWSLITLQALAEVAEYRLGLDGEREDLSQRQLCVEPDDLVAPSV